MYYKFKIEIVNRENETIETYEAKTKRDVKKILNAVPYNHYRTYNKKNDKLVKRFTKLNKPIESDLF